MSEEEKNDDIKEEEGEKDEGSEQKDESSEESEENEGEEEEEEQEEEQEQEEEEDDDDESEKEEEEEEDDDDESEKEEEEEEKKVSKSSRKRYTALIFGSTGACGEHVFLSCLERDLCEKLIVVVRKHNDEITNPKVQQVVWEDFEKYLIFKEEKDIKEEVLEVFKGVDVVFSCLGLSKGHAPSKKVYIYVNETYAVNIGRICGHIGPTIKYHYLISTNGANPKSSLAYFRHKGISELKLNRNKKIPYVITIRPSLLIAQRKWAKKRVAEEFMKIFAAPIANLLGSNDFSIKVEIVGRAMVKHFEKMWMMKKKKKKSLRIIVDTLQLKRIDTQKWKPVKGMKKKN